MDVNNCDQEKKVECSWMYIDPDCGDLRIAHRKSTDIPSGVTRHETVKSSMCYLTYCQASRIDI